MGKRGFRARRVDSNQPEIVAAFRSLGYSVAITSQLGHGFPDAVAGKFGKSFLIEIKPSKKSKLTPDEESFKDSWRGNYFIITSIKDVCNLDRGIMEGLA